MDHLSRVSCPGGFEVDDASLQHLISFVETRFMASPVPAVATVQL